MGLGQRQADDEGVRRHPGRQQHLPGQGNGHDEQRGEYQVGGEHPARQEQIPGLDIFHHGDMELPRQADDGDHRHARQGQHRRPVHRLGPELVEFGGVARLFEQVAETVVQPIGDEGADSEEGQQLDQRLEGDRQHHAAVVFGDVQVARAEQDGEQRQDQRYDQRGVLGADAAGVGTGADQQVDAEDDALELQGDIGQHADQADQRHDDRQGLGFAVTRRDEVGDRGDVLLLADHHHLLQHPGGEQHEDDRTQVDRQE
ncbi:hypothetical protein D3C84_447470 [compost metagenome]